MVSICRPAELDSRVAALGPAQLLEALQECSVTGLRFPVVRSQAHYDTDAPDALRLLRARRQRPRGCRAAEQCDDVAAVYHSIARSARRSDRGGTVRPSVLAVLRLMTKEKRMGCSTGMSPGFAPFRTLSTSVVT